MATISYNLQTVNSRISEAARTAGRDPHSIKLLAVSKTFGSEAILAAAACGQRAFGESYVQEGVRKITGLASRQFAPKLEWHLVGPLQSNKTAEAAKYFHWIHSIDRLKIAQRLSAARSHEDGPLQVCIQVNVSGEPSKHGIRPAELAALAKAVTDLPNLTLRGLMAIPEPTQDVFLRRTRFAQLRTLLEKLLGEGFELDTLSMGMSEDLEAAILEGATMVRIGSAIFGDRAK
jgi:PLP dependent protein